VHPSCQTLDPRVTKSTYASVTETPCGCGYLERSAENPDLPIQFDARLNEFSYSYHGSDGGQASLRIYHCPFCGGATPASLRQTFFAEIADEEVGRLREALARLESVEDVLRVLGQPDTDEPKGLGIEEPGTTGQSPTTAWYRVLTYSNLSPTADVHLTVGQDGRLSLMLQGKYLGNQARGA
jgi:hypothetical protein